MQDVNQVSNEASSEEEEMRRKREGGMSRLEIDNLLYVTH